MRRKEAQKKLVVRQQDQSPHKQLDLLHHLSRGRSNRLPESRDCAPSEGWRVLWESHRGKSRSPVRVVVVANMRRRQEAFKGNPPHRGTGPARFRFRALSGLCQYDNIDRLQCLATRAWIR